MDRNVAKEKIEKLLRLANDKGATDSEKATALDMAKKLSGKYGFKVVKNPTVEQYTQPHVSRPASQTLNTIIVTKSNFLGYNPDFVQAILSALGYKCKVTSNYFAVASYGKFNVEAFHNAYKQNKVRVVFRDLLKDNKNSCIWWEREDTASAKSYYCSGIIDAIHGNPASTKLSLYSCFYDAGYRIGTAFRGMKFDV